MKEGERGRGGKTREALAGWPVGARFLRLFPDVRFCKINGGLAFVASGGPLLGLHMAIHIHLQPACGLHTTGAQLA